MTIIYFPEGMRLCEPCSLKHTYATSATSAGMVLAPQTHISERQQEKHTHTQIEGLWARFQGGQNVNATHKDLSVPISMQSKTTQTDNRTLLGMSTERKNLFIVTFLKRQITSFLEKTQVCIWLIHHTVNLKWHFLIVNNKPEIKSDISACVPLLELV